MEIVRDLSRTYPSHVYYQQRQGPGQRSLYNVLKAYSIYDRQVNFPNKAQQIYLHNPMLISSIALLKLGISFRVLSLSSVLTTDLRTKEKSSWYWDWNEGKSQKFVLVFVVGPPFLHTATWDMLVWGVYSTKYYLPKSHFLIVMQIFRKQLDMKVIFFKCAVFWILHRSVMAGLSLHSHQSITRQYPICKYQRILITGKRTGRNKIYNVWAGSP